MASTSHPVLRALSRWEDKGLLDREVAGPLREEIEEEVRGESRRWAQYFLEGTGGADLAPIVVSAALFWGATRMGRRPGIEASKGAEVKVG